MQRKLVEDLEVQVDYDLNRGAPVTLAKVGEWVMIYTPTWIVMGDVAGVGTLAIELINPHIVYNAGNHATRKKGSKSWENLQAQPWPESVMRVPAVGVIVVTLP